MFCRLVLVTTSIASILALAAEHPPAMKGEITDTSGGAIESTIVLTKEYDSSFRLERKTDANGAFSVQELESDRYLVEISAPGFYTQRFSPVVDRFPKTIGMYVKLELNWSTLQSHPYTSTPLIVMAGQLEVESGPVQGLELCFSWSDETSCDVTNQFGQYYVQVDARDGIHHVTLRDPEAKLLADGTMNLTELTWMADPVLEAVRWEAGEWAIVPWSQEYSDAQPVVDCFARPNDFPDLCSGPE